MRWMVTIVLWIPVWVVAQEAPEIEVYQVNREKYVELWAKNPEVYPVTLTLLAELENMKSDRPLPATQVLPAHEACIVARLYPADPSKQWGYRTSAQSYMGGIDAVHDDRYAYRLPYRLGDTYRVSQGYGGKFSHQGAIRYSLDFNLPEGTKVYAARDGIVVAVEQSFNEGGALSYYTDKANYVTILHDDGTFADYSHLQQNSVEVHVGQRVIVGQVLARSGATGFVTGPHLHFGVKKVVEGGKFVTLPVKFSTRQGVMQLEEGKEYTAAF